MPGSWIVMPGLGEGCGVTTSFPDHPVGWSPVSAPFSPHPPSYLALWAWSLCGSSGQTAPSSAVSIHVCSRLVVLKLGCTLGSSESLTNPCPLGTIPENLMSWVWLFLTRQQFSLSLRFQASLVCWVVASLSLFVWLILLKYIYLVHEYLEQEVPNLISVYMSNTICNHSFMLCNFANTNSKTVSFSPSSHCSFPTSVAPLLPLPW